MSAVRTAKIFLVGSVGLFGLLTGLDNIIDYRTNFEVVRHVLSMDAVPADSVLKWRAITSPAIQALVYWVIIALELLYASLCLLGALRLIGARTAPGARFHSAKDVAIAGLAIAFALFFFCFLVIGGEWFQMWQAGPWNMQQPAFRFLGSIGLVLVFVTLPDGDL